MKLLKFGISKFRSIDEIRINVPKNKPLVLFGPNNAGKTNILSALNIALGESFPTYREMDDSDYFFRDKSKNPNIEFACLFDEDYYSDKYGRYATNEIYITYNYNDGQHIENIFHNGDYKKIYITSEQRSKCQAVYLDAVRNIGNILSYNSKYTLLSKFILSPEKLKANLFLLGGGISPRRYPARFFYRNLNLLRFFCLIAPKMRYKIGKRKKQGG